MHTNVVLAAIFAGSQIAAAAFWRPHNLAFKGTPNQGSAWIGQSRWGWGPPGPSGGWQGPPGGHGHRRPSNKGGFIGAHPKIDGKPSDGFIGKHRGHGGPNAPGRPIAPAPSQPRQPTTPPSSNAPTSSCQIGQNPAPTKQPPSSNGGSSPGGSFQSQVLKFHNVHRANHSASALTWSSDLASIAETIAKSCVFEHNLTPGGGGYGQNIAAGSPPNEIDQVVSNEFYNGEVNFFADLYGQANPSMANFEQWGHFSQLVWKNTQQVGCATVQCPGGVGKTTGNVQPFFTVCNYKPPGNVAGQYAKNVGKPLGQPSVIA